MSKEGKEDAQKALESIYNKQDSISKPEQLEKAQNEENDEKVVIRICYC
jgi:hypothetical protein